MTRTQRQGLIWIGWIALFLALEIPAAVDGTPGGTLSEAVWIWFGGWWWLLIVGLLLSLVAHFSPKHTTVAPVAGFGAAVGARIAWVQWGPWPILALIVLAPVAWLALARGEFACSGKQPVCLHRNRLGALLCQRQRRGPRA